MKNLSPVTRNKHGQIIRSDSKEYIINIYKSVLIGNPRINFTVTKLQILKSRRKNLTQNYIRP